MVQANPKRGKLPSALLIVVLSASLGMLLDWRAPGISRYAKDWLMQQRGPLPVPSDNTIIAIDEKSIAAYGRFPWPPTTVQGYRNKLKLLDPQLLAFPIPEVTPLHLSREWTRLLKAGGRDRKTKEPRPLGRKTVREVAGMVSAALNRGIIWGVATTNPARAS